MAVAATASPAAYGVRVLLAASLAPSATTLALRAAGVGQVLLFVVSAAALVPLAWAIGKLTEQLADQTGGSVAALLNATLGNAPELMIALVAIARGFPEVVRASLAGSVAANVLVVLGLALLLRRGGTVATPPAPAALALIALAAVLLTLPSAGAAIGGSNAAVAALSLTTAITLSGAYIVVSRRRLRAGVHVPARGAPSAAPLWSTRRSVLLLCLAMLLTVGVAETLVGSLETFAQSAGLSGFFVAAVVVALVGNAAEHGAAVVLARRGRIDVAADIALSSGAQVAALLIPAAVLAAAVAGAGPLTFGPVELAAIGAPAALAALVLAPGSSRRRALLLLGCYSAFALVSLLADIA